ncbi:MAG: hypothetical protein H6674_09360 [Dehalococcoidia bacterium]|nr:hypothetical protein [Dehalococcoidia bacterium]
MKIVDCVFQGGAGGAPGTSSCSPGSTGDGIQAQPGTVTLFNVPARTLAISSPVRQGMNASLTFATDPGETVSLILSATQSPIYSDVIKGTLLPGAPQVFLFLGALPGGMTTLNVPVPVLATMPSFGLIGQALYNHPTHGYLVSNPRLVVVLDSNH